MTESHGRRIRSSLHHDFFMDMYSCPKSATLFRSTLIFLPCTDISFWLRSLKESKTILFYRLMNRYRAVFKNVLDVVLIPFDTCLFQGMYAGLL